MISTTRSPPRGVLPQPHIQRSKNYMTPDFSWYRLPAVLPGGAIILRACGRLMEWSAKTAHSTSGTITRIVECTAGLSTAMTRARRNGRALRRFCQGNGEALEVEIDLDQRLARDVDRSPTVERAIAERAKGDAATCDIR